MIDIYKLEKEIENAESTDKIDLRLNMAYQLLTTKPSKSIEQAMTAYSESCATSDTKRELRSLYLICTAGIYDKDFTDYTKWIDLLIKRSIELNDSPALGRAYILQYRNSMNSGNLTVAAEYLNKALEFFDKEQHASELVSYYLNLGNIHMKLNDLDKGFDYYQQALPYAKATNEQATLMVLQNIGSAHVLKKEYRQAWEVYHEVLDQLPESDIDTRRIVLDNLGHICQHIGELHAALEYFQEAIDLGNKYHCKHNNIIPLCKIACINVQLKNYPEAIGFLQKAKHISDKSDNLSEKIEVLYGLIGYYKAEKDLPNLVDCHEILLNKVQELNESNMLEKVKEFEELHHISRYKEKINSLETTNNNLNSKIEELQNTIKMQNKEINALKTNP
jgi:tetratricopeptide (TPR) repeat protein